MLVEERDFIEQLELPECYFWAAHSLDAIRFQGYLGKDKNRMLETLDRAIGTMDEKSFTRAFRREARSI